MKEFKELAASGFEKFPADVLFKKNVTAMKIRNSVAKCACFHLP